MRSALSLSTLLPLFLIACSGATPAPAKPPEQPASTGVSAPTAAPEPPAVAPSTPSAPETEAAPAQATPVAEPAPEAEPGPRQKPSEILGTPNAAFVIDYNASAPKAVAEKTCSAEAADDVTKKHECMQKARQSFTADVLRFKKAGNKWTWTIYQRKGSALPEVYQGEVALSDESKNSIKIKIKGAQSGALPLFSQSKSGIIKFPNDYSITLDDPKHGHLVYDAKVGLVGD